MVNSHNSPNKKSIQEQCQYTTAATIRYNKSKNQLTKRQLSALKEFIRNTPETNQIMLQFLKEELANNHYQITSKLIAVRMLADIELI